MKINGKFAALAGAALLMGSAAFAQATDDYNLPQGFSFYNEISSDLVQAKGSNYNYRECEQYQVEFAGVIEKVGISYNSEKFEFELAPKVKIGEPKAQNWNAPYSPTVTHASTNAALNNDDTAFSYDGLDWHIRFTPFELVDLLLHTDVKTPGANLPVAGEDVGGNLGGPGLGVIIHPIDGLRIGLQVPFGFDVISKPNYANAEYEDFAKATALTGPGTWTPNKKDYKFKFNAGVDYKLLDMVTIGLFSEDIVNRKDRSYGLYAAAGIGMIDFKLGYTYNGDATKVSLVDFSDTKVEIGGHHKANLAAGVAFGDLSLKMDALFNFFKTQSVYDLYAGLAVGYDLVPGKFNVGLQGRFAYDMGNKTVGKAGYTMYEQKYADSGYHALGANVRTKKGSYKNGETKVAAPMVGIKPSMTYTTGKNTFNVAANLQYWLDGEGSYAATVPVSWKYTF